MNTMRKMAEQRIAAALDKENELVKVRAHLLKKMSDLQKLEQDHDESQRKLAETHKRVLELEKTNKKMSNRISIQKSLALKSVGRVLWFCLWLCQSPIVRFVLLFV